MNSSGIITIKAARKAIKGIPGFKSFVSRRKVFIELSELKWIGIDSKRNVIYIRSFRIICLGLGLPFSRVVQFDYNDLNKVRFFTYGSVLNLKLLVQKYAIKLQSKGRTPVAKKSDATQQESYPGLGKSGLAKLFQCSEAKAVRIKLGCERSGYVFVRKKMRKILSLKHADYNVPQYLKEIYGEKSFMLKFRKNYKDNTIDVYEVLRDEIQPLMKLKKRGSKRFNGIKQQSTEKID